MRFADPQMLWLLAALPPLAAASIWVRARRRRALARFAGGEPYASRFAVLVAPDRRLVKLLLLWVALATLPLALARPQWGSRVETVETAGADLVVALDVSLSMLAEDLPPNRFDHARHAIDSLLDRLVGDRVALVTFAGRARLICPLTSDHAALRLFLDAIEPDAAGVPGTAIADALRAAADALRLDEEPDDERDRAVVLFSDGEDHEGGYEEVLDTLTAAGVRVFTVGCGSPDGAPIPLRDGSRVRSYKKDREGKVVTTRVDETLLARLADRGDGGYVRATAGEMEVDRLVEALRGLEGGATSTRTRRTWVERFQWLVGPAWLLLALESLLGDRRAPGSRS